MSKISEMRNAEKNKINLISILEAFIPETKYIELYLKLFKII